MVDLTREPTYTNDHDLLIDMRRILIVLTDTVKELKTQHDDTMNRITAVETRVAEAPGKFIPVDGALATAIRQAIADVTMMKERGQWITQSWTKVGALVVAVLTCAEAAIALIKFFTGHGL